MCKNVITAKPVAYTLPLLLSLTKAHLDEARMYYASFTTQTKLIGFTLTRPRSIQNTRPGFDNFLLHAIAYRCRTFSTKSVAAAACNLQGWPPRPAPATLCQSRPEGKDNLHAAVDAA